VQRISQNILFCRNKLPAKYCDGTTYEFFYDIHQAKYLIRLQSSSATWKAVRPAAALRCVSPAAAVVATTTDDVGSQVCRQDDGRPKWMVGRHSADLDDRHGRTTTAINALTTGDK